MSQLSQVSQVLRGQVVVGDQLLAGEVRFGERIAAVSAVANAPDDVLIVPGFVDTHVHGGGGGDTMDGPEGVLALARLHVRHGTTSVLPTTMTNPWENVLHALRGVQEVMAVMAADAATADLPDGAAVLGAHLEGPFINPLRLGAQPPCTLEPKPELVQEVLALGVVRAVTLAPELSGALEAALSMARWGVRIGVGHSRADAETVTAFLKAVRAAGGRTAGTHLFNAMGGIEGRLPGIPGALLADDQVFPEVILDGIHVHPTSFRLACAAAPDRVMLVSDAMRAAGLGDGESELGGQKVIVQGGEARLEGGSLAGSVLTLDVAFRNAVAAGLSIPQVSRMLSLTPAQSIGVTDRGAVQVGLRADLVVLDRAFRVRSVFVAGREVVKS